MLRSLREEEIVIALVASAKKDSKENDEVGDALKRMDASELPYLLFSSLLEASSNICGILFVLFHSRRNTNITDLQAVGKS